MADEKDSFSERLSKELTNSDPDDQLKRKIVPGYYLGEYADPAKALARRIKNRKNK